MNLEAVIKWGIMLPAAVLSLLEKVPLSWRIVSIVIAIFFAIVLFINSAIRCLNKPLIEKIIQSLNKQFKGKAHIYNIKKDDPGVHIKGKHDSPSIQMERILKNREYLKSKNMYNYNHAIVLKGQIWTSDPVQLEVETLEFAAVMALREDAKKLKETDVDADPGPMKLTANVLIICAEAEKIIIQKRAKTAETNAEKLQVFGGGYKPVICPEDKYDGDGQWGDEDHDEVSLRTTAERKLKEESEIQLRIPDDAIRLLSRDLTNGNIQFTYLGCNVSKSELERARNEREKKSKNGKENEWKGIVQEISFHDLDSTLAQAADFSPTGIMFILMWLALGAPGYGGKFGKLSAMQLFEKYVK